MISLKPLCKEDHGVDSGKSSGELCMIFDNAYFINGTAYAGKSTMVKLLAEKYGGIECGENYHDQMLAGLSKDEFPNLTYTRDLEDWHDFIRRTPEEYENWFDNVARECEILELQILSVLCKQGKPVFVDTITPAIK